MNVLVVGTGSIGSRHLKNLVDLGHSVSAVDTNADRLAAVAGNTTATFDTLDDALSAATYDAAFICTFSNAHIQPALKCAAAGCHLFIEKPLSLDLGGTDELVAAVTDRRLISMVGCNMRFHPAVAAVHDAIASLGTPQWGQFEFGYYLPLAKPDYRNGYQAHRSLGGNLIFDSIHELDAAVWHVGLPQRVTCRRGLVSDLEMDTEDHVDMLVEFDGGASASIHMDYLQHGYVRRQKVVCDGGTAVWDFAAGMLGVIRADDLQWQWREMAFDIYYNQMYVDEAAHFMQCVRDGRETLNSIAASMPVLKLAVAADRSCETGQWETV